MTYLLLAAALATPPGWEFVDAATFAGRSALAYQRIDLTAAPPRSPGDAPPAGATFGAVTVGARLTRAVVWHAATNAVWIDADGDGRFAATERHTLTTAAPLEIKVQIPQERTLMIRRRRDELSWAVRGYTRGTVTLAGRPVAAVLTDGNGDGGFDTPGLDRVWLDLDGDGRFDALTEQFAAGQAVTVQGVPLLIRPRADGLGAVARARPTDAGTLQLDMPRQPNTGVAAFTANYTSEFGEAVVVSSIGEPVALPVGKYRVESIHAVLSTDRGKLWAYWFHPAAGGFDVVVERGKPTRHLVLPRPTVAVAITPGLGGVPIVAPSVRTGGMYLSRCYQVQAVSELVGESVDAEVILTEPGSVVVDRIKTGFGCGRLSPCLIRVPPAVTVADLEVQVVVPTGPWAGTLTGTKPLVPVRK